MTNTLDPLFEVDSTYSQNNRIILLPNGFPSKFTGLRSQLNLADPIDLNNEQIHTFEIKYSFFDSTMYGLLIYIDNGDMINSGSLTKDSIIHFSGSHMMYTKSCPFLYFNVIDVSRVQLKHKSLITFKLQDTFSYNLQNTYISKTIHGKKSQVFKDIIKEYKFDHYIQNDIVLNISDEPCDIVITPDISVWYYFENEFFKLGYRMYYKNKNTFTVDRVDFLKLKPIYIEFTKKDMVYTNADKNKDYFGTIFDFDISTISDEQIKKLIPEEVNTRINPELKVITMEESGASKLQGNLSINATKVEHQSNGTSMQTYQALDSMEAKLLYAENVLLTSNILTIVTPMDRANLMKDQLIGCMVNVELKGDPTITTAALEGDTVNSGKYIILGIVEKYLLVYGRAIQKLTLGRADFGRYRDTKK